jgi:hypothetical protein
MAKSHYLEKDRLANVIAAIQILGVADRSWGTLHRWVAELEASEELTPEQLDQMPVKFAERKKWATVFEQHPEFFKVYTVRGEQRVLLRLRYAQSVHSHKQDEFAALANLVNKEKTDSSKPDAAKAENADENSVSKPLSPDQMQVLIKTAMDLHDRAVEAERPPDRFRPFLMATIGAVLGTLAGGCIIVLLGLMQSTHPTVHLFD